MMDYLDRSSNLEDGMYDFFSRLVYLIDDNANEYPIPSKSLVNFIALLIDLPENFRTEPVYQVLAEYYRIRLCIWLTAQKWGYDPNPTSSEPSSFVTVDENQKNFSYSRNEIIGKGSNSIVHKGTFGNISAAVKLVKRKLDDMYVYEKELKIWLSLQEIREVGNVHIVTLFTWDFNQTIDREYSSYFVMELAKCDLGKWIEDATENQPEIYEQQILDFFYDVAKGLKYMHDRGIVHQDVKPQNILIFGSTGKKIAKLGGFGMSTKLPEISNELQFTKATDIFSLGMMAFHAISFENHPYCKSTNYGTFNMKTVDENVKPVELPSQNYTRNHLLHWMMQMDASERPNINQVLNHPVSWTREKSLQFLVDVSQTFHNKNDVQLMKLRRSIDKLYLDRKNLLNEETNWKLLINAKLVTLLLQRKSNPGDKEYDGQSVMFLVELIRDKYVHFQDLKESLISDECFGEGDVFSWEKYIDYFLSAFPDLVIFLFCTLGNEKSRHISTLRERYFMEFDDIPLLAGMK